MSMWHTILQDASFKGVIFDVMSLDDSDGKALVEHALPFVNGTVLEDMGTTGRQIQVEAVFWGKQYSSRLNQLLETLMESGSGTLVHPVWGRLNNMIAASWHFRHEADYVDYATLEITFRESGEPQKIFVFENQFLMELERLIAQIDGYRSALEGFIDGLMMGKQPVNTLFGSTFGLWSTACGVFHAVRSLFDLDVLNFSNRGEFQAASFGQNMGTLHRDLVLMCQTGLWAPAGIDAAGNVNSSDSRSARQRFDALLRQADSLHEVPRQIFAGLSSNGQTGQDSYRPQRVHWVQVSMVALMLRLISISVCIQAAYLLIENDGEQMTAPDLMHINRMARLRVQSEISALRTLLAKAQTQQQDGSSYALYQRINTLIETMRQASGSLNILVIAAINQKPPLIVRIAPLSGTMQQIAFYFYSDITRTRELMHLNPHIPHPNFVEKGTLINGYTQ